MRKSFCLAWTFFCLLGLAGPATAYWPPGWGWGWWPDAAWPYGARGMGRESYRAQEDALRSQGLQQGEQRAQQLRADQQAEATRRASATQQWAAVTRRQQNLDAQVASAKRYEEMRQEYIAERDRPRPPDEQLKRHKAWAESIRKQVRVAYADMFTSSWLAGHPVPEAPIQFRNPNPHHWWSRATWEAITVWVVGTWGAPTPYNWGQNVTIKNGVVYLDGKELAGAADFAAHALAIASAGAQAMSAPPDQRDQMQWLPLGVFALTHEAKGAPTIFVQLAIDKNGILAGTYFNANTEQTQFVQGAVERGSSRAAWSLANHKDTVMEAGVFNLTQDELPVLLHFGTEQSQRWLLTRLFPAQTGRPVP
jgi:hypothetical protein